ncbi:MAG: universal stress protein [Anderseniella sp.]|jgi:nucleotide-binding universal stress UspA family protein|nr:universal stress protein [Anderseniella sp.]
MLKKVLIATDGSDHGTKAVAFGSDIAAKYGAEVVLMHVLLRDEISENLRHVAEVEHLTAEGGQPLSKAISSVPAGRFPADVVFSDEDTRTPRSVLQAVGEHVLKQAEKTAREHGVSKTKKRIEDGNPVKRILEIIETEDVDLVVSGARGLSDLKALLMGSVSHKLAYLSPVTCVTVR